jgi:RNA polymerase sigma-70 factor, ECF subfamily
MRLTFAAQTAPCNHRFIVARASSASVFSEQKRPGYRGRFQKNLSVNKAFRVDDLPIGDPTSFPFMHRKARKHAGVAKPKTRRSIRAARPTTKKRPRAGKTKRRQLSVSSPLEPGAPSDLDLMQAIQAEDPDALAQLYDRYNGILKALILRVIHNEAEADDLLQEIFMEIWNQAKNFSAQKGKPLGWMVTLARRRAIDGLRKKQAYARAEERLQAETEQQPDAWVHNETQEAIVLSDTRILIRKVINGLPPAQQQAIDLAFFKGMSQREIAAKTNTPLGTVKTRLELGLKKIYDGLKELKDEL